MRRFLRQVPLQLGMMMTLLVSWTTAQASPALCEAAARTASLETGVPLEVMRAIAALETGRNDGGRVQPWPWTVNDGSEGHWFATRDEAQEYVRKLTSSGKESFDVGCFQLNFRWHGSAFRTLDSMFDPMANAQYAASFLSELYTEAGDWTIAAGRYHSRTEAHAAKYRNRFTQLIAQLSPDAGHLAVPDRPNSYQLLQRGHTGSAGSLVPRTSARNPLLMTARLSILGGQR